MNVSPHADPGYGDPNAPVGSAEWAKRWRLCFQSQVKQLPGAPGSCLKFYRQGEQHHAWTLVTDADGNTFSDFDAFCRHPQPYGLGMEPKKFHAYLAAEIGKQAADQATNSDPKLPGRPSNKDKINPVLDTGFYESRISGRKAEMVRAVGRAPEVIQSLFREGLVGQGLAASMGPAKPDEEKAARVVRARQAVVAIGRPADANGDRKRYRQEVDAAIRREMGKEPDLLAAFKRAFGRLNAQQRVQATVWVNAQ